MPIGRGKYDALAARLRDETHAAGVAVIVLGGDHGDGYSLHLPADELVCFPSVLRQMAQAIEEDLVAFVRPAAKSSN